ncbi:MAG: M3 family metallopeptidase, partial [Flavobacteriaceae bacterium]|nr:M3 family metallopeptidase [Flavobacteriaceae bacterium]
MSILNSTFETPFNTVPFGQIKEEEFLQAFEKEIQKTKEEIDQIVENTEAPNFENTIAALDYSGQQLDRLSSLFFNLNSAETNENIQKLAQQISPLLTEFSNDITLNQDLFLRVKTVYEAGMNGLAEETQTLLKKKYKNFVRNGALLSEEDKKSLRKIDKRLASCKLQFGEHVLAETNAYQLHLSEEEELNGLPQSAKDAAKTLAEKENKDGWIFTLDYPSYIPFMTYAENRGLRKTMHQAFGSKGFQDNENNNEALVLEIARLRYQRAQLLGYQTHAHFVLEERMAQSPNNVREFLQDLLDNAFPAAKKEYDELEAFAKDLDGIDRLEKWDGAYYSEKLKQKLFDLDSEKLKPYFSLDKVLTGAFEVANRLFGLKFEATDTIETYHESV